MEYIMFVLGCFFFIGFMMWLVASSESRPTPQQIKNKIILDRKLRKLKKALTPDEIIFPMLLGIIILGAVGFLAVKLS